MATKFGGQILATKFGGQILATKCGFAPHCYAQRLPIFVAKILATKFAFVPDW